VGVVLGSISEAVAIIDRGGVLVMPTETVYGFVSRPDAEGVARIFDVKHRPQDKTLQLLIPDAGWLDSLAVPSADARALAGAFWPGPLTLVVPSGPDTPDAVRRDGTVGMRVPAHPVALDLLAATGPLAASSANRSGSPPLPTVGQIREVFGDEVDGYLDGEYIDGPGSTVVSALDGVVRILRAGSLDADAIRPLVTGRFERG
jgi:L-threonylcarbamoyladenylate synthase